MMMDSFCDLVSAFTILVCAAKAIGVCGVDDVCGEDEGVKSLANLRTLCQGAIPTSRDETSSRLRSRFPGTLDLTEKGSWH